MAIRQILTLPDNLLRQKSERVLKVDGPVRAALDDMIETMYDAPGIGLAGVQVGIMQRLVVIDVARKDEPPQPLFLVNPEIVRSSPELAVYEEGCLSIPDYYEDVERPERVRVRFLDRHGAECEMEADGLLATAIQHEIDHLDGVLFIDHISRLKRERVTKRFAKAARFAEGDAREPRPAPRAAMGARKPAPPAEPPAEPVA
ncbi:peptide deformylase [Lichenibacterium dinghuense]|uniref:peptide deformylase n=1 Tax=Lichenibacterium dinghuense TaxID=2895977 RepID=UPI001F01DAFA|nr:peptide deformylase [Lichenibacterium sp. 6Y81]